MLPSACGLGQHFQDLGHSFSLYGPPSRQITYIQLFRQRLSHKSVKAYATMPIGIMGRKSLALMLIEVYSVYQQEKRRH